MSSGVPAPGAKRPMSPASQHATTWAMSSALAPWSRARGGCRAASGRLRQRLACPEIVSQCVAHFRVEGHRFSPLCSNLFARRSRLCAALRERRLRAYAMSSRNRLRECCRASAQPISSGGKTQVIQNGVLRYNGIP